MTRPVVISVLALALVAATAMAQPPAAPAPDLSPAALAALKDRQFVEATVEAERARLASWRVNVPQGTGPGKVTRLRPPNLTTHTLYWPADWSKGPLPIVAWANGSCRNNSLPYAAFLAEIASHGYFVVAVGNDDIEYPPVRTILTPDGRYTLPDGRPLNRDEDTAISMKEAVDWAIAENGRVGSPYLGKLDTSKIAYMGHSCGAAQALNGSTDPRTTTTVGLNSAFEFSRRNPWPSLKAPIGYFSGRWDDPANRHADENFAKAKAADVPMFKAALDDIEHSSAYPGPDLRWSVAVTAWLDWQLKGDRNASTMFLGADCGLCRYSNWNGIQSTGL